MGPRGGPNGVKSAQWVDTLLIYQFSLFLSMCTIRSRTIEWSLYWPVWTKYIAIPHIIDPNEVLHTITEAVVTRAGMTEITRTIEKCISTGLVNNILLWSVMTDNYGCSIWKPPRRMGEMFPFRRLMAHSKAEELSFSKWYRTPDGQFLVRNPNPLNPSYRFVCSVFLTLL